MEAIVFGGSGFIGSHLCRALLEKYPDDEIHIVDLRAPLVREERVHWVNADVRRKFSMQATNVRHVFNLAAVHRTPGHEDHEYFDTNVAGAEHVTAFCEAVGAKSLVFTSSISVYGPCEELVDESHDLRPTSAYGKSKLAAEEIYREWAGGGNGDRKLRIVRPAVIFGPGEAGNFTRLAKALARRRFVYPGRRDTIKACGYVDELIRSMWFALDRPEAELIYNFAYPQRYTISQICDEMCDVLDVPHVRRALPPWAVQATVAILDRVGNAIGPVGKLGTRVMKLVESTNVYPAELLRCGYVFESDLNSALHDWYKRPPVGDLR